MTRKELAEFLGDSTESTVNKWERGINPIPQWVADKMYRSTPVEFTLEEVNELTELARSADMSLMELLAAGARQVIEDRRKQKGVPFPSRKSTQVSIQPSQQQQASARVNEDPAAYHASESGADIRRKMDKHR